MFEKPRKWLVLALKKLLHQNKRSTKKKHQHNIYQTNYTYGCSWQTPPHDIMDNILQLLSISDRIRLSIVCKSWSSIVRRRDDIGFRYARQLPWLVLPQDDSKCLNFFSLYDEEGHVKMKLPKPYRGWCFGSSKGWLIMFKEKGLDSRIVLLNPISKVEHQLPSLKTIPSFKDHDKRLKTRKSWKKPKPCVQAAFGQFIGKIVLSSSNISECIIAGFFRNDTELGLCKPGGNCWTTYPIHVFGGNIIQFNHYLDILFSYGMLYALVNKGTNNGNVVTRTLNFDDTAVELKLVYDKRKEWSSDDDDDDDDDDDYIDYENQQEDDHGAQVIFSDLFYDAYLFESTINVNEVWLIHKKDVLKRIDDRDDELMSTSDFSAYKIEHDHENGNLVTVKRSLGNQILLFAKYGCLSFPASDFLGLKEKCIYYHAINRILRYCDSSQKQTIIHETRSLDSDEIKDIFMSCTYKTMRGESWLNPSL